MLAYPAFFSASTRRAAAFLTAALLLVAGCADLIGAEFDVVPADPAGTGGTGGAGGTDNPTTSSPAGGSGGAGAAGACGERCSILATQELWPAAIDADDEYVYWTSLDLEQGAIRRARIDGSGMVETLAANLPKPNRVVVSETHVYWTNTGTERQPGSLMRVSKNGGEPETLVSGVPFAQALALDDDARGVDDVYFAGSETLHRWSEPTGHVELLGPTTLHAISLMSLSSQYVFGTSVLETGGVWRINRTNLPEEINLLQQPLAFANGIAATEVGVFVATFQEDGAVWSVGEDLNVAPKLQKAGLSSPAVLVYDDEYLYWTLFGDGRLMRMTAAGGTATALLEGQTNINGLVVRGKKAFFTLFDVSGEIRVLNME